MVRPHLPRGLMLTGEGEVLLPVPRDSFDEKASCACFS